jgi:arylsulfatase A-like enzyme
LPRRRAVYLLVLAAKLHRRPSGFRDRAITHPYGAHQGGYPGLLKPLGYATGQFGKNHLGDKDEFLPTNHGLDEFFGNLYHLNAEEEPEDPDYPKDPEFKKHLTCLIGVPPLG